MENKKEVNSDEDSTSVLYNMVFHVLANSHKGFFIRAVLHNNTVTLIVCMLKTHIICMADFGVTI